MKSTIILLLLAACIISQAQVPITHRKYQITLIPQSIMNELGSEYYKEYILTHSQLPESNQNVILIRKVGDKISKAAISFLKENGYEDMADGYNWEFNLVNNDTANAFCLPGGKVCFLSGILKYTQDENGIAVVMAHEIAHAIAQHGNESMSQGLIAKAGEAIIAYLLQDKTKETRDLFLQSFGVGTTLGLLAYSRQMEYEADKIGLVLMVLAGYDPEQAVGFWKRMSEKEDPERISYFSTHPVDADRIEEIKAFIPEAKKYKKY